MPPESTLPDFVTVHRRALTPLDVLKPAERESLGTKFAALHSLPVERWSEVEARRLKPEDSTYVVRVTPQLLAFFSPQPGGGFLIEDFVRPELLERYFAPSRESVGQV
ncbi:MAG: hypothetical protein L0Z62_49595 [Gemmataceae bacterium]|nr:hypothetical protein [Gemmataceae bacterium]